MNFFRTVACALTALALAALPACGTTPRHAAAAVPSLPPSSLGAPRSALQIVHGVFGDEEVAFQCVVDVQPERVTVVGLSALGQRWFSLQLDRNGLTGETRPELPVQLEPRRILADLQLALWPLAAWQQALNGSEWQVSEPAPGTRRLRHDGRLVAEVHYAGTDPWRGRLWLSNFEHGYSLAVDSQALP